jgi:protein O-GlcNAc transferase
MNDYVERAVWHSLNQGALAALRARLRSQLLASPICDAQGFTRSFEAAMLDIWKQWCLSASGPAHEVTVANVVIDGM